MKIKNKARLVKRAERHLEEDRYIASAYLRFGFHGVSDWRGCEIGCLAMPSTKKAQERQTRLSTRQGGHDLSKKIRKEFNICIGLQRLSEAIFEDIDFDMLLREQNRGRSHRLGSFVVSFVKAIPESRDIDNQLIVEWCEARGIYIRARGRDEDVEIDTVTTDIPNVKIRRAFLDWLRRGAPKPVAQA